MRWLTKLHPPKPIFTTFYRGTILTICIKVWYGNCPASDGNALQRIVWTEEDIIGTSLPRLTALTCPLPSQHPWWLLFPLFPGGHNVQFVCIVFKCSSEFKIDDCIKYIITFSFWLGILTMQTLSQCFQNYISMVWQKEEIIFLAYYTKPQRSIQGATPSPHQLIWPHYSYANRSVQNNELKQISQF